MCSSDREVAFRVQWVVMMHAGRSPTVTACSPLDARVQKNGGHPFSN